ncbi:response regulator [Arenibacter certesii]|uniref:Response regulator n=1 Tax=Arenibacter certesii TaxID=228955 RepID=A0A918J4C1_9FLAO|nr:response regulator [Arenibacter certesii]GGW46224.1 response regulator [Arenibacter certesii]
MKEIPNILLADDDPDDCMFFREALVELSLSAQLTFVNDGEKLIDLLINGTTDLPDILFLDLNMPIKNGVECLTEIKSIEKLKRIPVVIISTSYDSTSADELYRLGAAYYIQKPIGFSQLQDLIFRAIKLVTNKNITRPDKVDFLLSEQ